MDEWTDGRSVDLQPSLSAKLVEIKIQSNNTGSGNTEWKTFTFGFVEVFQNRRQLR